MEKIKGVADKFRKDGINAWILLTTVFAFMLIVFAPIEAYYSNKSEFWFSIWQVTGSTLVTFIVVEIVLVIISYCLCSRRVSLYCYTFLMCAMVYLYIQGNYVPRNYGVLTGAVIEWDQYVIYGAASIVLALVCFGLGGIIIIRYRKIVFKLGSYLSIFIFSMQIVTLFVLVIRGELIISDDKYKTKIVTENKMLELSENNNIIVFILDSFDREDFNYLLNTDYIEYSKILKNFTYYEDTLGAYPSTKGSLPFILTGVWYKNEQPYVDYVENSYVDNAIYDNLKNNNYSVGIYTDGLYLSSDIYKYENVEVGTYRINNILDFINGLYKMVAFNYAPHQWKQYFLYSSKDFDALKKIDSIHQVYSEDIPLFENRLNREGITAAETENCFRLYHLEGVHPPHTFGKELIVDKNATYNFSDAAAGNLTLLKEYIEALKDLEIYDKSTILIMADHGHLEYNQNPIFLIKNRNEKHDFKISDVAMSFEYLSNIWIALANGKIVDETFINNCRGEEDRRFLYYAWDDSWDRDFLPTILEVFVKKDTAGDEENIVFSGSRYDPKKQAHPYSLGSELSFIGDVTARPFCISGFFIDKVNGTKTNGAQSIMDFDITEKYNNLLLTIESGAYDTQQDVSVYANDHLIADVIFDEIERKEIIIPNEYAKDGSIRISMKYPKIALYSNGLSSTFVLDMKSVKLESTDRDFNLSDQIEIKYELGTVLSFYGVDSNAADYCVIGFSGKEETFTWTDGNKANMKFYIKNEELSDMVLEYTCTSFNGKQHVVLYANDKKIADYDHNGEETKEVTIPVECIGDGELNLRFELPDAKSPKELGMSEDSRILGLAMKKLVINVAD